MSAHSPGPWRWWPCKRGSYAPDTDYVQIAAGNTHVAKVLITSVTEADLRLMTAAPELLAALVSAVECGMVPVSSAKEGGAVRYSAQVKCADMIRAAIAKATGAA